MSHLGYFWWRFLYNGFSWKFCWGSRTMEGVLVVPSSFSFPFGFIFAWFLSIRFHPRPEFFLDKIWKLMLLWTELASSASSVLNFQGWKSFHNKISLRGVAAVPPDSSRQFAWRPQAEVTLNLWVLSGNPDPKMAETFIFNRLPGFIQDPIIWWSWGSSKKKTNGWDDWMKQMQLVLAIVSYTYI